MSRQACDEGFNLMAMLLGNGPDAALQAKMGLVLVQIVDKVCEQQLDARFQDQLNRLVSASVVTPAEFAKLKHDCTRNSATILDLLGDGCATEQNLVDLKRTMQCNANIAMKNSSELRIANTALEQQVNQLRMNMDELTDQVKQLADSVQQQATITNEILKRQLQVAQKDVGVGTAHADLTCYEPAIDKF